MSQDKEDSNVLLEAQLRAILAKADLVCKDDMFTFNMDSMVFAANEVLSEFHSERFEAEKVTFDSVKDALEDIVSYLFNILNGLEIDICDYSELSSYKESMPMLIRTDKILATTSMMAAMCELVEIVWIRLDSGLKTLTQAEFDKGDGEEDVEETILDCAVHIMAIVDTLCHHYKTTIKELL